MFLKVRGKERVQYFILGVKSRLVLLDYGVRGLEWRELKVEFQVDKMVFIVMKKSFVFYIEGDFEEFGVVEL